MSYSYESFVSITEIVQMLVVEMKWLKLVVYFLGIKEVTTFSVNIVEVELARSEVNMYFYTSCVQVEDIFAYVHRS